MSKKVIKLENWSVVNINKNPYSSPESGIRALHGDANNHPKLGKDVSVTTSAVISAKGHVVKTKSGSRYQLGKPDPAYLIWLKVNHLELDEKNPVKVS